MYLQIPRRRVTHRGRVTRAGARDFRQLSSRWGIGAHRRPVDAALHQGRADAAGESLDRAALCRGRRSARTPPTSRARRATRPPSPGRRMARARWRLDLGQVRDSARVRLNGRELATLIGPPYQIVLDDASRAGDKRPGRQRLQSRPPIASGISIGAALRGRSSTTSTFPRGCPRTAARTGSLPPRAGTRSTPASLDR